MATDTKQSWDEMKSLYPDQWLAIVEFETNKFGDIASGVVVAHGKSFNDFPPPPSDRGEIALQYTGESTYRMLDRGWVTPDKEGEGDNGIIQTRAGCTVS